MSWQDLKNYAKGVLPSIDAGDLDTPKANLKDGTFKTVDPTTLADPDVFEGGTRAEREAAYQRKLAKEKK